MPVGAGEERSVEKKSYTIREAAEECGISYEALRKRVDRGHFELVKKDGVRRIPRLELERTGLIGGPADPEVVELRAETAELRRELTALRALPAQIEEERQAREELEKRFHEEHAERAAAEERERAAEEAQTVAEAQRAETAARLNQMGQAGFFERRRLLRELRHQAA